MTRHLPVVAIGDDVAVILSTDMLDLLNAHAGGTVEVENTAGGVKLVADRGGYDHQMAAMRRIMDRDREILRALAQ